MQRLYTNCLAKGLAPATVRQLHAILRKAIGQAERWGSVSRNIVALTDPPRIPRHEITPLSQEQTKAFLDACKGDPFEARYVTAVGIGLRLGESMALRWRDVDIGNDVLQVRHTLTRDPEGFHFTEPKSARSRRRIALPPIVSATLKRHKVRQAEKRLNLGPAWHDNDLVFPNEIGRPLQKSNLQRRSFIPLLKKAECPRIRFHDLRHTAATLLLSKGVHAKVVSEMLGHSSIGLTLDTYSHVLPDIQEQAASAMDTILSG